MNEPLEDLMARARRGKLGDSERRRLECGVTASLEAKLLFQAGCGFDQEPVVMTGDETFLEDVAAQAARRFGHASRHPRHRVSALAVAVWVTCGIAAAGTVSVAFHVAKPFWSKAKASTTATMRSSAPMRTSDEPGIRSPASVPLAPAIASSERQPMPRTPTPNVSSSTRPTALALFQLANAARSDGRVVDALREYQRIQREFPNSREAALSTMSLGMLELQRGNAQAALAQFRQAYAMRPSPEALWGESQALRLLGREEQERPLLEELLIRYPGSAYAPAASKRLGREE